MSKQIATNKRTMVKAPEGDVADFYQVVEFVISYFGNEIVTEHDTQIVNGVQTVIGGCGFIPHGFVVA